MNVVRVTYTTRPEFSGQNQENIKLVMKDLKQLGNPGIVYYACLQPDGKTFSHSAFFRSEEDKAILFALGSFRHFQEQLKLSAPEAAPKQEVLTLIDASNAMFNL